MWGNMTGEETVKIVSEVCNKVSCFVP
jgi:hypothetical protein